MSSSSSILIIAIDGGAASGKSSTARALSARFNLMHVDTGSFYRAITAALLRAKMTPDNPALVTAQLLQLNLGTRLAERRAAITVNDEVLPEAEIRSPAVNAAVSHFAAQPAVRSALLAYQRNQPNVAAENGFSGLIMEGRDIGSVIFPDAPLRFSCTPIPPNAPAAEPPKVSRIPSPNATASTRRGRRRRSPARMAPSTSIRLI